MNDFDIEIIEERESQAGDGMLWLPVNYIAVGSPAQQEVQIYIRQGVYKEIDKHAAENMSKEVGSILLGQYMEDGDRRYVVIEARIEAKYTDATASTLTFTHETWDYVNRVHEKKYPKLKIVGWQHTHPGYGIFLSNYDMFIQENFFNLPWQVAYVVDPIASERGFFAWEGGKTAKQSGYLVYDEAGKRLELTKRPKSKKPNYSSILLGILLLISLTVMVAFGIERGNIAKQLEQLKNLQKETAQPVQREAAGAQATESFYMHTVQAGECLEAICESYGLDYVNVLQKVLRINGINNPDKIFAGQTLYLPMQ